jgi:hypothetical protein
MLWGIWSIAGGMLMRGNKGIFSRGDGGWLGFPCFVSGLFWCWSFGLLVFWPFRDLLVVY